MRFWSKFTSVAALSAAIVLTWLCPARAQDADPKQFVAAYMDALQKKDLYHILGGDLPVEMQTKLLFVAEKGPMHWSVKNYTITDVKVDGGLAVVLVEENHSKDLSPDFKAQMDKLGKISELIHWGDNKVTEKFVLVKLNGKWEFDTGHSGLGFKEFPLVDLMNGVMNGKDLSDSAQHKIADFINNIGIGQFVNTLNAYAPILVPAVSYIMEQKPASSNSNGGGAPTDAALQQCEMNLKNIGAALELYASDHDSKYPKTLAALVPKYMKSIPNCPAAKKEYGYEPSASADAYSVTCAGHNHASLPANTPKYTNAQGLIVK